MNNLKKRKIIKLRNKFLKNYFIAFSVCLNIMLIGGLLNLTATSENRGRMPVYGTIFDSNTHFQYDNPYSVNFHYLSDIFEIDYGSSGMYFSIGDVLAFLGFVLVLIFSSRNIYVYIKEVRKLR